MKKIYIEPNVYIVKVATEKVIANSLESIDINTGGDAVSRPDAWVKGDRAGRGGRSDYNVWNDDWSQ